MTAPVSRQTGIKYSPRSLTGKIRSPGALLRQFAAETQGKGARYAWHRFWGELNLLPGSMANVWDHAAADADYAAHMVNGSPDEETLAAHGHDHGRPAR